LRQGRIRESSSSGGVVQKVKKLPTASFTTFN